MLGKGSVILIKGKPEEGRRRLYITTVDGFSEFRPGVKMIFLNQNFHRVIMEETGLTAVPVAYRNELALKSQLNLKSPGRISLVLNNDKTPLHWITTKHLHFMSALHAVQPILIGENHLFENESSAKYLAQDRLTIDALETLFYGKNKLVIFSYHVDDAYEIAISNASDDEANTVEIDWTVSVEFMLDPIKYAKEISALQLDSTFVFDIAFTTGVTISSSHFPGDYENPPESNWEIDEHLNLSSEIWINGNTVKLSPNAERLFKTGVSPSTYFSDTIESAIKKNYKGTVSELFLMLLKK